MNAPGGSYDVLVGRGLLGGAEHLPALPGAEKAFVVADASVAAIYGDAAARAMAGAGLSALPLTVGVGEITKSLETAQVLFQQLAVQECHRDDVIVALGGGVVGDLAGFVAATYMRGIAFLQMPTTLLAQVDASIGGKVGVNLPRGKNLVGAFHQPRRVIADVDTLATLPEREFRSGLAEVAKYGLAVDPSILHTIETRLGDIVQRDPDVLEDLVARCAAAKAEIVSEDERDHGRRAILNYGHTLGHALEGLAAYRGRSHGEAVAVGMVFAARLAVDLGLADASLLSDHLRTLASLGLPHGAEGVDPEQVLEVMRMDKKYRQGLRFVLLEGIGKPRLVEDVSERDVTRALEGLRA